MGGHVEGVEGDVAKEGETMELTHCNFKCNFVLVMYIN